jgi:hypothetical protein
MVMRDAYLVGKLRPTDRQTDRQTDMDGPIRCYSPLEHEEHPRITGITEKLRGQINYPHSSVIQRGFVPK